MNEYTREFVEKMHQVASNNLERFPQELFEFAWDLMDRVKLPAHIKAWDVSVVGTKDLDKYCLMLTSSIPDETIITAIIRINDLGAPVCQGLISSGDREWLSDVLVIDEKEEQEEFLKQFEAEFYLQRGKIVARKALAESSSDGLEALDGGVSKH
jgi:hypothetical protein